MHYQEAPLTNASIEVSSALRENRIESKFDTLDGTLKIIDLQI